MPLLNYWTKIWTTITQTRNQGPDGQKILKTKKLRALKRGPKKFIRKFFFVRTKGHLPPCRILPNVTLHSTALECYTALQSIVMLHCTLRRCTFIFISYSSLLQCRHYKVFSWPGAARGALLTPLSLTKQLGPDLPKGIFETLPCLTSLSQAEIEKKVKIIEAQKELKLLNWLKI